LIIRVTALAALVSSAALAVPAVPREALADVGRDTLAAVSWPLQLDTPATYILAFAAQGTASLFREDTRLYKRLHRLRWSFRRRNVFDYTLHMGHGLFDLGLMAAFAFGDERARRTSITGIEALASVAVTSVLLKRLFRVPRPESNEKHKNYFSAFHDDAFPSGHTMSAFATAAVISAEYPSAAPFAYAIASLVGLSVMKRGWHWPSDVLAGGALGLLIGRASVSINRCRLTFAPSAGGLSLAAEI
jgi:undecaprenyl-diphosphatase